MPRTRQSDPLLTQTASEKFNLIELIPKYDGNESLGIRRFMGKISDVVNLDPTHSNLTENDDIARVLISRFEKTVPLSTRLQLFSSCIQGSSESVQEFAARINKLGTQIFQSSNSAQNTAARNANDQLLQSRFISALRNNIRRFVLARDPNNLEKSINAALIEEQNVKLNQIANDERTGKRNEEEKERKNANRIPNRPWGNAAGEFSVFRHPNTHSFDQRRVHFHDSAFRDNYTVPRHSATVPQRTSRGRGNAAGFRRNTRNDNLNFRGESRF
ncbi:hypothetical protein TNCV_3127331 [Trichonephila clavipes]|nr:hypothetical protein TNCV_3127331 [Trichonephila clavipes]